PVYTDKTLRVQLTLELADTGCAKVRLAIECMNPRIILIGFQMGDFVDGYARQPLPPFYYNTRWITDRGSDSSGPSPRNPAPLVKSVQGGLQTPGSYRLDQVIDSLIFECLSGLACG